MVWRFLLFFSLTIPLYAQHSPAALKASLRSPAIVSNPDSVSHYLVRLGYYYYNLKNYDSADHFYRRALLQDNITGNKALRADNLNNLGVLYQRQGMLDSAIFYSLAAHQQYLHLNDSSKASIVEINLGMLYNSKGLYEKSLGYLLAASYKLEKSEPSATLATCYNTIGNVYLKLKEPRTALHFHYKSLDVKKKLNFQDGMSASYNNLGNVYLLLNQYDSALNNFQKSLEIKRLLNDKNGEGVTLNNIGELMMKMEKFAAAEALFRESLTIRLGVNNRPGQVNIHNNLARVYLHTNRLTAAGQELQRSYELASEMKLLEQLKDNFEIQVMLNRKKGDFEKALDYSERLLMVKDSILNEEKAKSLAEMQTRYESMKKEDRITLLEKEGLLQAVELEQRQIWIRSLVGGIILVIIIGVLIYYNLTTVRKNKIHIELLLKELHHRVKNNLQILSSLLSLQSQQLTDDTALKAVKSSESRINAMALIHRKLYTVDQNRTVDIKEYITELIEYLVYSYGYHEKNFKLDLEINEISIDVDKAIPLGLILNELISNAFKHAYQNQPNPRLMINLAYPDAHELNIRIRDNGAGMPPVDEKQRKTFGMKIVTTLIKELKGRLDVKSGDGTTCDLNIPI